MITFRVLRTVMPFVDGGPVQVEGIDTLDRAVELELATPERVASFFAAGGLNPGAWVAYDRTTGQFSKAQKE
jgi:hypothetical protein